MKLAARARVPWLSAILLAGATLGIAIATLTPCAPPAPVEHPHGCVDIPRSEPAATCPPATRATLHVDASAVLRCAAVQTLDGPGLHVIATYTTTEGWERIATVTVDGTRLVGEMFDQPSRSFASSRQNSSPTR